MSDFRLGRIVRALRHRLGWRQEDVARSAGVSQDGVSRVERGLVDPIAVGKLRRILAALGAELVLQVRWRGGELDRLLDEGRAALVGGVAGVLSARGWVVRPEVSFSVYGERGSIDLVAWHAATRTVLVVEVKTEVVSVEETLRRHDAKVRLSARIVVDRFGWSPRVASRLLILPDSSTSRRRIARHEQVFLRAYPLRGRELGAWLRTPSGEAGGLLFLSPTHGLRDGRHPVARKRIRRHASRSGTIAGSR